MLKVIELDLRVHHYISIRNIFMAIKWHILIKLATSDKIEITIRSASLFRFM
jgi:hypothetical protein